MRLSRYMHTHPDTHTKHILASYLTVPFEADDPVVPPDPDRLHVALMPEPGGADEPENVVGDNNQKANK